MVNNILWANWGLSLNSAVYILGNSLQHHGALPSPSIPALSTRATGSKRQSQQPVQCACPHDEQDMKHVQDARADASTATLQAVAAHVMESAVKLEPAVAERLGVVSQGRY